MVKFIIKKQTYWFCLLCALAVLLPIVSLGEDCFTLNIDTLNMDQLNNNDYVMGNLSAQTQGIRVVKTISNSSELAQTVRLTLMQMDTQALLFDKDYGYQSNVFDSGVIYLPYVDNRTIPYLVTLYVGDMVYASPFMQLQPRLSYNGACTYGPRLRDLANLTSDWLMGTMLDLNSLRSLGSTRVDVCASNCYVIGQANVAMQGSAVSVSLDLIGAANVEVNTAAVYVVTDCSALFGDPASSGFPAHGFNEWIDVGQAQSALLYVPMQVSYDPSGLSAFQYDLYGALQVQLNLWEANRGSSGEGAVPSDQPQWPDSGWQQEPSLTEDFIPMTEDELIAQAEQNGQ